MSFYQKLRWLIQMGIEETICEFPVNRLKPKEKTTVTDKTTTTDISRSSSATTPADTLVQQAVGVASQAQTLADLAKAMQSFHASTLKRTAANTVFAAGNPQADIMIIGDMPEASDDLSGIPFSAEPGELLKKMMAAIGLSCDTHCYTSVLIPWRAPGGRKPTSAEIAQCLPFIKRHIELANPKVLVLFGALTSGALLGIDSLSRARGIWHPYQSEKLPSPIPTLVTFSPAYLIKNPAHKKHAWEDLKRLQAKISESESA